MKHRRRLTFKEFKRYFSDHLQPKDKHDFEKRMMQDAFEEEAYDGLSGLSSEEFASDMKDLRQSIGKRSKGKTQFVPVWFRYAASVLLLVAVGVGIYISNDQLIDKSPLAEDEAHFNNIQTEPLPPVDEKQESLKNEEVSGAKSAMPKEASPPPATIEDEVRLDEGAKEKAEAKSVGTLSDRSEKQLEEKITMEESDIEIKTNVAELSAEPDMNRKKEAVSRTEIRNKMAPSAEDKVLIRGAASLSDTTGPLVIVNGKPFEGNIKNIDPDKIEYISVLKRKEATSLFGSRGSNGVIIIQTQSGEPIEIQQKYELAKGLDKQDLESKTAKAETLANKRMIRGRVVNKGDSSYMPGVSVIATENPVIGTVTDINGQFVLNIPENKEVDELTFAFVGMETLDISIKKDTNILVMLEPKVQEMSEVVVVGYTKEPNRDISETDERAVPPNHLSMRKYEQQVLNKISYKALSGYPGKHRIKISFTVNEDGSLTQFNFKKAPAPVFEKQIIEAMKEIGPWKPAKVNGQVKAVAVSFRIKIEIPE